MQSRKSGEGRMTSFEVVWLPIGGDGDKFREKPAARQIHRVPLSWSLIRLGPNLSRSSASPTMLPWSAPKKAKAQAAPFSAPFPRYPLLAAREEDSCLRVAAIS
ncbi:hypothetical protein MRB53_005639 [Persea americana]|uniref:Uncharacterized protein n=1 Tax=Persea americana TaxID=3435 RepID=A0ACC2ME15_PERAE|nr:hypothetical protein MRB53_005639 [Persea americana]